MTIAVDGVFVEKYDHRYSNHKHKGKRWFCLDKAQSPDLKFVPVTCNNSLGRQSFL